MTAEGRQVVQVFEGARHKWCQLGSEGLNRILRNSRRLAVRLCLFPKLPLGLLQHQIYFVGYLGRRGRCIRLEYNSIGQYLQATPERADDRSIQESIDDVAAG